MSEPRRRCAAAVAVAAPLAVTAPHASAIRGNLIHDVRAAGYGAGAIYPDEGSSHVTIEDNVAFGPGPRGKRGSSTERNGPRVFIPIC
jgi:hypothetical protein